MRRHLDLVSRAANALDALLEPQERRAAAPLGAGGFAGGADRTTGAEAGRVGGIGGGVSVIVPSAGFTEVGGRAVAEPA